MISCRTLLADKMNCLTLNLKEMNIESKDLKDAVKRWIINVDKTEGLPSDIVALRFNLL